MSSWTFTDSDSAAAPLPNVSLSALGPRRVRGRLLLVGAPLRRVDRRFQARQSDPPSYVVETDPGAEREVVDSVLLGLTRSRTPLRRRSRLVGSASLRGNAQSKHHLTSCMREQGKMLRRDGRHE